MANSYTDVKTTSFMQATVKARLNASLTYNPHIHINQIRVDRIGGALYSHPSEYFAKWYIAEDDFLKFCWVTHDICGTNLTDAGMGIASAWARVDTVTQDSFNTTDGSGHPVGDDGLTYDISNSNYHGFDNNSTEISALINEIHSLFQNKIGNEISGVDISFDKLRDLSGVSGEKMNTLLNNISEHDYIQVELSGGTIYYYIPVGATEYSTQDNAFTWARMDDGYEFYFDTSDNPQLTDLSASWATNGNRNLYRSRQAQDARIKLLYAAWDKTRSSENLSNSTGALWPGWMNLEKIIYDSCNNYPNVCQWKYETKRRTYDQINDGIKEQVNYVNMDEAVFSGINVPEQEYIVNVSLTGPKNLSDNSNCAINDKTNMVSSNYIFKHYNGSSWVDGSTNSDDKSWSFTDLKKLNVNGSLKDAVQLKLYIFGNKSNQWQKGQNLNYGKNIEDIYKYAGCKMIATTADLSNRFSHIKVQVANDNPAAADLIQIMTSAEDKDGTGYDYSGTTLVYNDSLFNSTNQSMTGGSTKYGTAHIKDINGVYMKFVPPDYLSDICYTNLASHGESDTTSSQINIMDAFSDFTKMHNDGLRNFIKTFWTQPEVYMDQYTFTSYVNGLITQDSSTNIHEIKHTADLREIISTKFVNKKFRGVIGQNPITLKVPVQICGSNYKFHGTDNSFNEVRNKTLENNKLGDVCDNNVTTYDLIPVIELVQNKYMMVWDKDQEAHSIDACLNNIQDVSLTELKKSTLGPNPVLYMHDNSRSYVDISYVFATGIDKNDYSLKDLSWNQEPFAISKTSDFVIRNAMGTRQLTFSARDIDDCSINNAYIPGHDLLDGSSVINPDVDFYNKNMCDASGVNYFSDISGEEVSGNVMRTAFKNLTRGSYVTQSSYEIQTASGGTTKIVSNGQY